PPLIEPGFRPLLYCLVAVYVFNAALAWITLSLATKREVLFFVLTAAIVAFSWFLRPLRVAATEEQGIRHRFLILGMRLAVGILALGQIANLFGYYSLSQY